MTVRRTANERRRGALFVLALAVGHAVNAPPASAHSCSIPIEVPVGRPSRVDVSVVTEAVPVVEVEVEVPDGYRLEGRREQAGWEVEVGKRTVRFTGGRMEPYSCVPFSLTGRAIREGELVFPVEVRFADGTTARFDGTDASAHGSPQFVQAVPPGGVVQAEAETGGDGSRVLPVAVGSGAVVLAGAAFLHLDRRRRAASARSARERRRNRLEGRARPTGASPGGA